MDKVVSFFIFFMKEEKALKNNHLADSSITFLLLKLSLPAMTGLFLHSLLNLIDTYFIAKLGAQALAAHTFTLPIQLLLISLVSGTGVGLTSLISRTLGKANIEHADNIAWHGLFIGILYALIFTYWGSKNIELLLIAVGCSSEIIPLAKEYLEIYFYFCGLGFIFIFLSNIIQGEGNTFWPVIAGLLAMLINVLLDPLFIFGWGPIAPMGIAGAALASGIAQAFSLILMFSIIKRKKIYLKWLFHNFRPSFSVVKGIYQVGLPSIAMELASVFIMVFINKILAAYSFTAVAALGIFLRVRSLIFMPLSGLALGAMPIAGFAFGAKNYDRVKESIIKASFFAFVLMSIAWYFMQFHSLAIIVFFTNDAALTIMGVRCMEIASLFLPLMGPLVILYSVLQALDKSLEAMWLSLIRQLVIFLPLLIILPQVFQLNGVWLAISLSELISSIFVYAFFIYLWRDLQGKKKIDIFMIFNFNYISKRVWAWLKV